jgi:hypothetical protein
MATRAVPAVAMFLLLVACGGGSSDTTASGTTGTGTDATDSIPAPSTATTRPVATTPGPPQTPRTGPLTTPPTARGKDDYLPAGVPDQIFPPGTAAYQLLKDGQCGPLLRQITKGEAPTTAAWSAGGVPAPLTDLYTSAAQACLAQWVPAKAAFQRIVTSKLCETDPGNPGILPPWSSSFTTATACQDERLRVYRWTENLLKAHDANPAFVPNFPTPPKA